MATEAEEALLQWCLSHQQDLAINADGNPLELAERVRKERVHPGARDYLEPYYRASQEARQRWLNAYREARAQFGEDAAFSARQDLEGIL